MDRDWLFGPGVGETTLDVLRRNAVDRRQALERLANADDRTPLSKKLPFKFRRRWLWAVLDTRTGKVLRGGHNLTERGATKRLTKAYEAELRKYHAERERKALAAVCDKREQGATS